MDAEGEVIFVQSDTIVLWAHSILVQEGHERQAEPIRILSWKMELGQ